jgi:hypothetical protein
MKKQIIILALCSVAALANAAPGDGPVIDAGQITILGSVHGEIKNGRQGGGGGVSVLWGLFGASGGANETKGGRVNVHSIVQEGNSTLKVNSVLLDSRLYNGLTNNNGDVTISGITQIGK